MDLHKLRVLKFDDHSSKKAAAKIYPEHSIAYNDISNNPTSDYPTPAGDNKRSEFVSGERRSRPRKRISHCKKRKSASDVSLPSQNKLKKHTRKRTLSLSDVQNSYKNRINCHPIKHTLDLLGGDSELHINEKRRHRKKRRRHNKINKDLKIMFICETPRIARKSRKRSNKHYRKDSSYNLRSSDDVFGFQKNNRAVSQCLYNANCNYFNKFRKLKMGLQRKNHCPELQPRHKHTRVRVLSSDYLSSIGSSLKNYNLVNTNTTNNGQKCVKLHSDNGRKTRNLYKRPTVDAQVSVAPFSLAKLRKSFCNRSVGPTKSNNGPLRGSGTRCQYHETQLEQKGMRLLSHEMYCPLQGTSHSNHGGSHPLECPCPSGANEDTSKCETIQINQNGEHRFGTRTCSNDQHTRLYARVLERITTLCSRPQTIAKNVVKYALLGLLIIIGGPFIFAIGLAWLITYPLKQQHVMSVDKANKPSAISCLFRKIRKNHRETENKRIYSKGCSYPKRKGFLSWLSNWSVRAAGNICKSSKRLLSIFKIKKNHPASETPFCVPKHPNPEKKYSLVYEKNRGWVMKPARGQELSTLYHRYEVVQNVRQGCRFNALRQKLARNKRQVKKEQCSSLFRCPATTNVGTMPTCWKRKTVLSQTSPFKQVITLPKPITPNVRHTRSKAYTANQQKKMYINHVADKSHIFNHGVKDQAGGHSVLAINASYRPPEIKSKEASHRMSNGINKKLQPLENKNIKPTQFLSSKNVAMTSHFPAYGITCNSKPQRAIYSNPYRSPNKKTQLFPNLNEIQPCKHHNSLKTPRKGTNNEQNNPSNLVSLYSNNKNVLVDKPNTVLSKRVPSQQYNISHNPLSSRHFDSCKLQYILDKLSKYLEQRRLTDQCLNEQNVKNSHPLEYARKRKSSTLPSTSRFGPRESVISFNWKYSGDPLRKSDRLYHIKQHSGSPDVKCTCVDKKFNHLYKGIEEQYSAKKLHGRCGVECPCLPQKLQDSAHNKNVNRSSKKVSPKNIKCTCEDVALKIPLEDASSSYSPENPSLHSQSTKHSAQDIDRYSGNKVNKLHTKKGNRVSSNICRCFADSGKPEDNLDTRMKQQIEKDDVRCPYCERKKKRKVVGECSQGLSHLPSGRCFLKRRDPSEADKKLSLRNGAVSKSQTNPLFLSRHDAIDKNSAVCECPLHSRITGSQPRPHTIASGKDKRGDPRCECPTDELQFIPRHDPIDKSRTVGESPHHSRITGSQLRPHTMASGKDKRSDPRCECPTEELQFIPRHDPIAKNKAVGESPLHSRITNSQSRPHKIASGRDKSGDPRCECPTDELQCIPRHDPIDKSRTVGESPLHSRITGSQPRPHTMASGKDKRSDPRCECPTEELQFIPRHDPIAKNKAVGESPLHSRITNSQSRPHKIASGKDKRDDPLSEHSTEELQCIPRHDSIDKNREVGESPLHSRITGSQPRPHTMASEKDKRSDPRCECPTEELQFIPHHDPIAKNKAVGESPLHSWITDSQSRPYEKASGKVKRDDPLSERPTDELQFIPRHDPIDKSRTVGESPLHSRITGSQPRPHTIASRNDKSGDPWCECPTEELKFIPLHDPTDKNRAVGESPLHSRITGSQPRPTEELQFIPQHVQLAGKNKINRNSTLCGCFDKNLQYQPDELALTHDGPKGNRCICECRSKNAQLLPQRASKTKIQSKQKKEASVIRKGVICECQTTGSQSPSQLLTNRSAPKLARGLNVNCTCLGKNSTLENYPHDRVPLRSSKSDKEQTVKKVAKTTQQSLTSQCPCWHEKPKGIFDKQSKYSASSDEKNNLKRSFEKMHLKLSRYFSNDHECACSSDRIPPDHISQRSLEQPYFGETPLTLEDLAKTSTKIVQASSSREKFGRYLRKSVSKRNSKLSLDSLRHTMSTNSGEKQKHIYGKESTPPTLKEVAKTSSNNLQATSSRGTFRRYFRKSVSKNHSKLSQDKLSHTNRTYLGEKQKHLYGEESTRPSLRELAKTSSNNVRASSSREIFCRLLRKSVSKTHSKFSQDKLSHTNSTYSGEKQNHLYGEESTPPPLKELATTSSNNLQASSSRELFSRSLRNSVSKIHSKWSQDTLNHTKSAYSDEKQNNLYGKESQHSIKLSHNGSSQRVRFQPLETTPHSPSLRQPRPVIPNKCMCPNDETYLPLDSQSHHTVKLKTGKTHLLSSENAKLSQRSTTSSKNKINSLRNTIDKLYSLLARYMSISDIQCMCSDYELDHSFHKDSQHLFLPDKEMRKSKLTPIKQDKITPDSKTLVDKRNNGLFQQYPPSQQAISPAKQRHSTDQVTAVKCSCKQEVHRPSCRTRAVSTQRARSANDPSPLLGYTSLTAQPLPRQRIFRSKHRLPPQAVNISKRRRLCPPLLRCCPTLLPEPLCRKYVPKVNPPESKRKKAKRRPSDRTHGNYWSKIGQAIIKADDDMWPEKLYCEGRMYIHTLRNKPCYCLFKCCPSMYPCFLSIYSLTKGVWKMLMYFIAVICWCPFFCCVCLCCEDLCCCLRR